MNTIRNLSLFGVEFDVMEANYAASLISDLALRGSGCSYVVTPNVDHILSLRSREDFRIAYSGAALTLIDGWPVAAAVSSAHSVKVPVVPGSDLVPLVLEELNNREMNARVFLLGALPGVADLAAERLIQRWPNLVLAGTHSPDFGFENDEIETTRICEIIRASNADLLVVGLGAPKQELWVHGNADSLGSCVAVCAGATIDFLAGHKSRAPSVMRRARMEWVFRALSEPKRLGLRYLRGMLLFPPLAAFEVAKARFKRLC